MRYLLVALSLLHGLGDLGRRAGQRRPSVSPLSTSASTCRCIRSSSWCRAIPSTTILEPIRITSSTTACTGCTRATIGTRAAGTTGRGRWWDPSTCRCSCCAFRYATTASLRRTFAAGAPTRRRAGVSTGAAAGNGVAWDGTDGTTAPPLVPHRCRSTSGQYSGDRYPRATEQQHSIRSEHYRYRPREAGAREHFQQRGYTGGPRAEPQRQAPGPQQPQDRGRMRRPEPRDDGRENRNEERRGYPGGPRAEPQRQRARSAAAARRGPDARTGTARRWPGEQERGAPWLPGWPARRAAAASAWCAAAARRGPDARIGTARRWPGEQERGARSRSALVGSDRPRGTLGTPRGQRNAPAQTWRQGAGPDSRITLPASRPRPPE